MKLNPVAREPVAVIVLAAIITWALAHYGVDIDPAKASGAAGVVLLVGGAFARQLVRPVAKDDDPVSAPVLDQVVREVIARVGQAEVPPTTVWSDTVPRETTSASGGPTVHKRPPKPEGPDPTRTT